MNEKIFEKIYNLKIMMNQLLVHGKT